MNEYKININELSCECEDWKQVRSKFEKNNPKRLCKHLIDKLDINNLSNNLNYFKDDISFYQKYKKGFNVEFEQILNIPNTDYIVLFNKFDWINIYEPNGFKYGFLIDKDKEDFHWAKNLKPKKYQEVEIFFSDDEFLPSIPLSTDEENRILSELKKHYKNINISKEFMKYAYTCDDSINFIEYDNKKIKIFPHLKLILDRDIQYVEQKLQKRKEERKKKYWYLENYKKQIKDNIEENKGDKEFEELEFSIDSSNKYNFETEWEHKLKEYYLGAVVDKALMLKFDTFKLPRFVSEFIVSNFIEKHGIEEGILKVEAFLSKHYPKPNSTDLLHYRIQTEGEINIIDNFKVSVHIERHGNDHTLTIPALNIKNAMIEDHEIIYENPRLLSSGLWGMGKITRTDDEHRAVLTKFKAFQVSSIDLNLYKDNRKNFDTNEWLDIMLSTVGFNYKIFQTLREKLIILSRLLPLIQKSTFLFEFGKPGTGKTYIFDKLSNNSFVISGSKITPAKLFKDCTSKQEGLLRQYEAILFDEIDKINNSDFADEIVNKLLKFMESNTFDRCGEEMSSNSSLIFSGNISRSKKENNIPNFFEPLAIKLKGEAFLDRFNGVIPGWEIKPLSNVNKNFSTSQGFSADYFSIILSELRLEDIEAKVESMLEFSENTTNRDGKAIVKSISGFFKLIFPNQIIDKSVTQEIVDYCVELRQYIINERFNLYGNEEDKRQIEVRVI